MKKPPKRGRPFREGARTGKDVWVGATDEQKEILRRAAEAESMSLGPWLLKIGLAAAKKILASAAARAPKYARPARIRPGSQSDAIYQKMQTEPARVFVTSDFGDLGIHKYTASALLGHMERRGLVMRAGWGRYRVVVAKKKRVRRNS